MVEMLVVLTIVALIASLATAAGASLFNSGRLYRGVARVTHDIALSREQAIARYEQRRIRLDSGVAQSYVVESCALSVGTPGQPCLAGWTQQGTPIPLEGVGVQVTDANGQAVTQLIFDRTGRFYIPDSSGGYKQVAVTIKVCTPASGGTACSAETKNVQLAQFSGMISVQ